MRSVDFFCGVQKRANLAHKSIDKRIWNRRGSIGKGHGGRVKECEVNEAHADEAVVPREFEREGEVQGRSDHLRRRL